MYDSALSSDEPPSRPEMYAGARRRFTGIGTIAAGFVALVLVLGATLTSELDRYSSRTEPPVFDVQSAGPSGVPLVGSAPSGPAGTPAAKSSGPPPASAVPGQVSTAVAAALNEQLDDLGCAPVTVSPPLVSAAMKHAAEMVDSGYIDATGPDGMTPAGRAKTAGYGGTKVTESIVLGAETPALATTVAFPPPVASDDALPVTVQVVSRTPLSCGWKSVGAEYRRDTRRVPLWSILLGR